MLAGFYVVAFTLLAADAALVWFTLWGMVEFPSRAGNWSLVLGGSIPAASALLYGIATVSRTEEPRPTPSSCAAPKCPACGGWSRSWPGNCAPGRPPGST
jgi:hypothetical protein